jgi:hypothetical protein
LSLESDFVTWTVNSVPYTFFRRSAGDGKSIYTTAEGLDDLVLSQTRTKNSRIRTIVRFDRRATVEDPLATGSNFETNMATYVVNDRPSVGFDATAADWHQKLLSAFLVEGTPDFGLRVLRGEN